MNIKTDSKTTIESTMHIHNGEMKTYPCNLGDWWGEDKCRVVDFNDAIQINTMPEGEYKVTIILEKI